MSSQQLLQEPGAKGECGLATLCKPRLLEQESWGTARNSMDMLEKVLEDSEAEDQDGEAME